MKEKFKNTIVVTLLSNSIIATRGIDFLLKKQNPDYNIGNLYLILNDFLLLIFSLFTLDFNYFLAFLIILTIITVGFSLQTIIILYIYFKKAIYLKGITELVIVTTFLLIFFEKFSSIIPYDNIYKKIIMLIIIFPITYYLYLILLDKLKGYLITKFKKPPE